MTTPTPNAHRFLTISLAGLLALTGCRAGASPDDEAVITLDDGGSASCFVPGLAPTGREDLTSLVHPAIVVATDLCETDADCVPDGCHASSCVAAALQAPRELLCTAECRYGTTDCGGGCLCQAGHCAARLSQPPSGI